jgi:hypothetical protein
MLTDTEMVAAGVNVFATVKLYTVVCAAPPVTTVVGEVPTLEVRKFLNAVAIFYPITIETATASLSSGYGGTPAAFSKTARLAGSVTKRFFTPAENVTGFPAFELERTAVRWSVDVDTIVPTPTSHSPVLGVACTAE